MAEKVIKNNESIVPFLGERLSFIRGLDPLGLQNTSDATFSLLLPGLNNVTGRIRYYSFYCWVLDLYSKEIGSTNPDDQRKFIRRAEYIIALASHFIDGDRSSIPGSLYANKEIEEKGLKTHDLQAGTFKPDGTTRSTYWTYPNGAFGQYYYGSLSTIGIISERENHAGIFVRINSYKRNIVSGENLAEAFDKNLSKDKKQLFIDIINKDFVSEKELKDLLPDFNLAHVPQNSEEQNLLIKLLIEKDYPLRFEEDESSLRRQTIKHLLRYLNTHTGNFSDRIFIYDCYDAKGKLNELTDECLTGWYYYQFNEFWQYANTSILNGTLGYLEDSAGPNWMSIHQLVSELSNGVIHFFINKNLIQDLNESVNHLLKNIKYPNEYEYFEEISKSKFIEKIGFSFMLIFSLYLNNKKHLFEIKEYSEHKELAKDGEGAGYFITQFNAKKQSSISAFIYDYIYLNVIYRHQYVAFRKMRGGNQSTQKFIIEDLHIRYLGNFEATYTGPRVGNLISFLKDLDVITNENTLSILGQELLTELNQI